MRLTIDRIPFLAACQQAEAAVPNKPVKPALGNLLVEATEANAVTITGTDTQQGVRVHVASAEADVPGKAMLPAGLIRSCLSNVPDARLVLEARDGSPSELKGLLSPTFYELPSADPAHFPAFPAFDDSAFHEITAGTLRHLLRLTAYASADATTRYSMCGAQFVSDANELTVVATDGRRLGWAKGIASQHNGHHGEGVIPNKAAVILERMLDDPEDTVRFRITANEAMFATGTATLYTLLVEGRFPDWRGVIPKNHVSVAVMDAGAFQSAVKQAAVVCDPTSKAVLVAFSPGIARVEASGEKTMGRSRAECEVEWDGPNAAVMFNPDYLLEFLKSLPAGSKPELRIVSPKHPALFVLGEDVKHIVMPLD